MPDALEVVAAREAERAANYESGDERADLLAALDDTLAALHETGADHVFIGGLSSSLLGRPRVTHDIDVLVRPSDARALLDALGRHGFDTEERAPHWLYKGYRGGQEIDVIFRSAGDMYLDDEMLEHAVDGVFEGRHLQLLGPEDVVVMKSIAHEEHSPRHWHDALSMVARDDLDWDYLARRGRRFGARRVAALLLYAESNDLVVPGDALATLLAGIVPGVTALGDQPAVEGFGGRRVRPLTFDPTQWTGR